MPPRQPTARGEAAERASLALRPDARELVPFEPLRVLLIFKNISARDLALPARPLDAVEFLCARDDGPFLHCGYGRNWGYCTLGLRSGSLAPGRAITSQETIFSCRPPRPGKTQAAFVFDRPGTYKLKAAMGTGPDRVESEAVEIAVKPPTPEEAEAAKLMTGRWAARLLSGISDLNDEGRGPLEQLATRYPESRLADHANYALGWLAELRYGQKYSAKFTPQTGPGPEGDDAALAVAAYRRFAAVSGRLPILRTQALLAQTRLVLLSPAARKVADVGALRRELDSRAELASQIGFVGVADDLDDLRRKLVGAAKAP